METEAVGLGWAKIRSHCKGNKFIYWDYIRHFLERTYRCPLVRPCQNIQNSLEGLQRKQTCVNVFQNQSFLTSREIFLQTQKENRDVQNKGQDMYRETADFRNVHVRKRSLLTCNG